MNSRGLVKKLAVSFDAVLPPSSGIVVLIYHRVGGGSDSEVDLDPEVFDAHLQHIVEHRQVLALDEAVDQLRAGTEASGVVLTFDDGTADFADVVVPALARYDVPATLYAATRFIDEAIEFPWGAPALSWSALRDSCSTGLITVGSHTHSHWLLDRLDAHTLEQDLDRSIELIGEHVGHAPTHFAYPKALPGSRHGEIAVRRRFESAALAQSRVNRPGQCDLHRLWRTPVQRSDDMRYFSAKAAGGLRLEGELRALTAKVKYRGQTK